MCAWRGEASSQLAAKTRFDCDRPQNFHIEIKKDDELESNRSNNNKSRKATTIVASFIATQLGGVAGAEVYIAYLCGHTTVINSTEGYSENLYVIFQHIQQLPYLHGPELFKYVFIYISL